MPKRQIFWSFLKRKKLKSKEILGSKFKNLNASLIHTVKNKFDYSKVKWTSFF